MQAVLFRTEISQYVLVLCVTGTAESVMVALLIVTASNITAGHRIRVGICTKTASTLTRVYLLGNSVNSQINWTPQ